MDAGFQFLGIEWLGDIIIRAGFEALDEIVFAAARGQKNDVSGAKVFMDARFAADIDAVHSWHEPVEDQERRRMGSLQLFPGLLAIRSDDDLVAPSGERDFEEPS